MCTRAVTYGKSVTQQLEAKLMTKTFIQIAGNGFVGRETSRRLAAHGQNILVHHTGAREIPRSARICEVRTTPSPLPIVTFPDEVVRQAQGATVIHFNCMGRADARAFVNAFGGLAKRLVLISSCDVYRSYGLFVGAENGPLEAMPLSEDSALRSVRYPYRRQGQSKEDLLFWYDKIDAEEEFRRTESEWTILRLPKVFGEEGNKDLATIYGFQSQPNWRWTHGHITNVAEAISLAARHRKAANEVFNIGEEETPTMGERLSVLPPRPNFPPNSNDARFEHHLHINTSKIRTLLGFKEIKNEREEMRKLAASFHEG